MQKQKEMIKLSRKQRRNIIFAKPTKKTIFNQIVTFRSLVQRDYPLCTKYFKFINSSNTYKYTKDQLRKIKNDYMKFFKYDEELTMSTNKFSKKEISSRLLSYAKQSSN